MMRFFGGVTLIFYLLVLIVCVASIKRFSDHIFSIDGFSCKFDNTISQKYVSHVMRFLYDDKKLPLLSLKKMSKKIKDEFPFIASVIAARSASGILHIQMTCVKPQFLINEELVLSDRGQLFEKTIFSEGFTADLPCCFCNMENAAANSYKQMFKKLPIESFKKYKVVWESTTKSNLYDKNENNFSIVFNDKRVPDEKILLACDNLKLLLRERGEFFCRNPKRWVADIRFKDQIVLFSKRGGGDG